jgi:hypothetical protein
LKVLLHAPAIVVPYIVNPTPADGIPTVNLIPTPANKWLFSLLSAVVLPITQASTNEVDNIEACPVTAMEASDDGAAVKLSMAVPVAPIF